MQKTTIAFFAMSLLALPCFGKTFDVLGQFTMTQPDEFEVVSFLPRAETYKVDKISFVYIYFSVKFENKLLACAIRLQRRGALPSNYSGIPNKSYEKCDKSRKGEIFASESVQSRNSRGIEVKKLPRQSNAFILLSRS